MDHSVCVLHRDVKFVEVFTFSVGQSTDSEICCDLTTLVPAHAIGDNEKTPVRVHGVLVVRSNATLVGCAAPSQSQTTPRCVVHGMTSKTVEPIWRWSPVFKVVADDTFCRLR